MTIEIDEYSQRVESQIEQFREEAIHDLPEIFHVWSHNFIRPGLLDVFGVESVNDFYVKAVEDASQGFRNSARIMSIGCGDGDVEVELAHTLKTIGGISFHIDAFDISPILIENFNRKVMEHGLSDHISPCIQDINKTFPSGSYDVVLANHSLHHIVELESVFDLVFSSLKNTGIFATSDMIGRNGHMRWPETEAILQTFWPLLSETQRYNHQLKRTDLMRFQDHDCSNHGFEGIRSQDILELILRRFRPNKFFGFGGFIDVLVDRGYGPGFDVNNEHDKNFIVALAKLNDMMLDAGMIKPTMMMAHFAKEQVSEVCYRGRTALGALRVPSLDPEWVRR